MESVKKCKDGSYKSDQWNIVMGFINVEWKNIAGMGKEKNESFTKHFSSEEYLCLCSVLQEELARFVLVSILVLAAGLERLDSHIVFWVTGSHSASCRVLQNCSCSCVQKGGGWFCYDCPNSKGKRLSTLKSSVFILTAKKKMFGNDAGNIFKDTRK